MDGIVFLLLAVAFVVGGLWWLYWDAHRSNQPGHHPMEVGDPLLPPSDPTMPPAIKNRVCPHCGKTVAPDRTRLCNHCGREFATEPFPDHGFARYCASCGAARQGAALFCPACGASFEPSRESGRSTDYRPAPASAATGCGPVAVVILAVLVVVAVLWLLNSTRLGLDIKCRYLNDMGACVEEQLLTSVQGPQTALVISESAPSRAREVHQ